MKAVAVKELKNRLSSYLREVRSGEVVLVTDRGRAEDGFPNEPVRTLDAIHLASAIFLRQVFPDLVVLSTDERIGVNAELLGFETAPPRS